MKIKNKALFPNWSMPTVRIITLLFLVTLVACNKDGDDLEGISHDPSDLCLVEINGDFEDLELDEAPIFLSGGTDGLIMTIGLSLVYPAEARENGIEGMCVVEFEITEEGMVENIVATQDPGGGIGTSLIGVIESVTTGVSFSPGILNGNTVRVKKDLSFNYKLEG